MSEWNYVHAEDRKLVLLPVGWETHSTPSMGEHTQAIINKQVLVNCDLLIAVFWTRLGSPTEKAASGTVEEIEEHLPAGKPAMLYVSSAPVRPDSVDGKQYDALKAFKADCYKKGLVESYDTADDFRDKLSRQLSQTIIRHYPTPVVSQEPGSMSQQGRGCLLLPRKRKHCCLRLRPGIIDEGMERPGAPHHKRQGPGRLPGPVLARAEAECLLLERLVLRRPATFRLLSFEN